MHRDTSLTALRTSAAALGLRRTRLGRMTVHAGRERGEVATLLLHGAAGSWTTWTPLIAASDRLGTPLTDVIIPDLPGWGDSAGTVDDIGAVSAELAAMVRSQGFERWRVVGHSLGGFVALDLAAREPEATVGVGLVSPSGPGVQAVVRRPFARAARVPGFAGMLLAMRALSGLGAGAPDLLRGLDRVGLLRPLAAPLFARLDRIDPSVISALADEIRPVAFGGAARLAAAYDTARWRTITASVVSVRGERDVFAAADEQARLAAIVPRFREVRMRSAGHFAHVEQPVATLRALGLGAAGGTDPRWRDYRRVTA
ncbi:alpha/beta hydrolase [Microbacterium sp. cx-55]|uniref:alpha/beta fold hydrolase n=1 Tax=Microbacterium sp. cx-55 TaxID=2875948 RepID=UPI001CC0A843|nr:alpha/beta hydrolase [Microbacterium sp. cx-55]MBZ4486922.1 alpha/beta hydrolase [Microbacterium sp. cx-55]UGB35844.1 alpha/beta hydrolase [Microbacterium sp. cx-55]